MSRYALILCAFMFATSAAPRPITLDDLARMQDVADPQVSPDGRAVLYTVSTLDSAADRRQTDIWMVNWDGSQAMQLTFTPDSESSPQWSPDGTRISFLSSRPGKARGTQVWVLDKRGGEAHQLTDVKGAITSYSWSPDSKRLALVLREGDEPEDDTPRAGNAPAAPKPIVINRYHFKQDVQGYLGNSRNRIFLYDIATKK